VVGAVLQATDGAGADSERAGEATGRVSRLQSQAAQRRGVQQGVGLQAQSAMRALTLVIERTVDPTTWLIVTGWSSTATERKLLEGSS
jgi:hypothetical protein